MGFKIHVRTPAIYVKFIVNKVPLKHLWIKQPGIPDQGMKGLLKALTELNIDRFFKVE